MGAILEDAVGASASGSGGVGATRCRRRFSRTRGRRHVVVTRSFRQTTIWEKEAREQDACEQEA